MLYKYKASIRPTFDSKNFVYFDHALTSGRRRILDKWFYFYINDPIKPVVIWKDTRHIGFQIQPGSNRYIGTALRKKDLWVDAVLITNDAGFQSPNELKVFDLIDAIDSEDLDCYKISLDNPVHKWGIGKQTLYNSDWIAPVFDWVHNNLKYQWGMEYRGVVHYVNSERRLSSLFKTTKMIVKAEQFISVQEATQHLFETIKSFEFRNL
jgi:hypothetical protein